MNTKISMDKKYTYKGKEAIIITITRPGSGFPVLAMYPVSGNLMSFTSEGFYSEHPDRFEGLVEVKPTRWINIYKGMSPTEHCTRVDADEFNANRGISRSACLEFKEGEGL